MSTEVAVPGEIAAALLAEDDQRPAGPERAYFGYVIIEWPAPLRPGEVRAIPGWKCAIFDAETGKPILAMNLFVPAVTVAAQRFITCELTMDADEDGKPAFDGEPHFRDGKLITGTFPFLVAEMRVRGS